MIRQTRTRMAGQNLGASLGVPDPATGIAQGHHGHVDAMIGQPGHLPYGGAGAQIAYAAQHGAFAQE